jgi:hypothetical protein
MIALRTGLAAGAAAGLFALFGYGPVLALLALGGRGGAEPEFLAWMAAGLLLGPVVVGGTSAGVQRLSRRWSAPAALLLVGLLSSFLGVAVFATLLVLPSLLHGAPERGHTVWAPAIATGPPVAVFLAAVLSTQVLLVRRGRSPALPCMLLGVLCAPVAFLGVWMSASWW